MEAITGLRVLIVDDCRDLCDAFASLLSADGAAPSTATTGREALTLCRARRFDAILCDLGLPDMPGELVIREMLSRSRPRPAVAVITGHGDPHLARARAAGAQATFGKPVEWERVLAFLHRLGPPARDALGVAA